MTKLNVKYINIIVSTFSLLGIIILFYNVFITSLITVIPCKIIIYVLFLINIIILIVNLFKTIHFLIKNYFVKFVIQFINIIMNIIFIIILIYLYLIYNGYLGLYLDGYPY